MAGSLKLEAYTELVRSWASRVDLVAPRDLERFEERHVDDSLRALPFVRAAPPGPAVDVGSGSGVPGIPLAIAHPGRHWRLLEPRRRRAAFLEEAVRALELDCEVFAISASEAAARPELAGAHSIAVARALAPPAVSFRLLLPLLGPAGAALVFVGEGARLPPEAVAWGRGLAIMRAQHEVEG